ncbi:MAG: glutathione S-transferase family protein [Acetobacteraceae bacterium]
MADATSRSAGAIVLLYGSGSPFAWKVWLALEHKALPYEARRLSFDGDLKTPAFSRINPRRRVPVLIDGAFSLSESSAIIEYLEDRYASSGESLWPADVQRRAIARRIACEVDIYLYPAIDILVAELLSKTTAHKIDTCKIAEAKHALIDEMAMIDTWLTESFVAGKRPSAADFAFYPMLAFLGRIDRRHGGSDWRGLLLDRIVRWMARVESLPYFGRTYPPHWREQPEGAPSAPPGAAR